ncbi:fatty acid-binding protein, liver-like [Hyposmocoma kahamanoa]|uniref:fatty acid-binding protein, liver-like n=1 Tax=Hyposmocoma kahamanoa TaxID=1477025 RepID=UPI000E6D94A7|nr:fatty acid-binding protein, liver-like [Hyposmocoma kahamanoa]
MSFSGKKFRRIRSENIDELMKETNVSEHTLQLLKSSAPIFSFTREDDQTFTFVLQTGDKTMTSTFKLGEEHEMERRDGSKVKVTYELEGDNVLKQVIKQRDGKIAHFRREFGEKETKMTITLEGVDKVATIYYEMVE